MKNLVCVVIPIYKEIPSDFDIISLKQCFKKLKEYEIVLVAPRNIKLENYECFGEFKIIRFSEKFFKNIEGYNKLLLSPFFYLKFLSYKFILIHQTDAFIFKDELKYWCSKNYDYIGAPWFENFGISRETDNIKGVGNGGLSLRKVNSIIRSLLSFSYLDNPKYLIKKHLQYNWKGKIKHFPELLSDFTIRNNSFFLFNNYQHNEDKFYGLHIKNKKKWFNVANEENALKFSFELYAKKLYSINNNKLPFGCHGWNKYSTNFWKNIIEKQGYKLKKINEPLEIDLN